MIKFWVIEPANKYTRANYNKKASDIIKQGPFSFIWVFARSSKQKHKHFYKRWYQLKYWF